ncbi:Helicase conserved C-terminal domain-containing protein [Leifsonia sp. 98AMF]|uniref:DEAD/DEAH box helicase n=1 Tax=unclassified Leifsonia TaxID=2663824 RepID=UPI00087CEFE5|nr:MULTISPECIES: DEAD/DEAH box helicase [unclassified Leifsonia]SDH21627.1 Helicase conserved C-terminal domain-containing protein [Leifsonia sp. 197AMF]SDJ16953.1 Helicase conserved C-terminal domain-containing protein [Leifsonia sp. 466MF]SDJ50405.1 Helicase conserved C-terminal domain-containing protein [Leifsonia sp. 157MF]SDN38382.1 Helicase conserved C-terminal domain-containing protein [Leifsonia sp. 509MF]SEM82791.1 Helicase conserved C-terminal domain-containing protein [Leifsonia sp.
MERALDAAILAEALGRAHNGLPSAEELQEMLAQVEIALVLRRASMEPKLIETAWYLHAVASVEEARNLYSFAQQRRAFQVSAHIFDLALSVADASVYERQSWGFAAAIGYRRGGLDPNAAAIAQRFGEDLYQVADNMSGIELLPSRIGLAFLTLNARRLFPLLSAWRRQLEFLADASDLVDLSVTSLGSLQFLILGAEDLLYYFARGNAERYERGMNLLRLAASDDVKTNSLDARWVAAHLFAFGEAALQGSLWNPSVLPDSAASIVRSAFTTGGSPVFTLWEPQRELLTSSPSPYDPQTTRMVLAVPTSGGKSLVAQILAVEQLARTGRGVCYVVPTRSLAREVRAGMSKRVRVLQREVKAEQPDYNSLWDLINAMDEPFGDVEVMTPERLAHLLRHDADGVLRTFGMFIFDEAQLLAEQGRGFILESAISLLHVLTQSTEHKIMLISAAMGNSGGIAQWVAQNQTPLVFRSDWRGPRRLHAIFSTEAEWSTTKIEKTSGTVWKYRHITELKGVIRVRLANGRVERLVTQGDTGWRLVRKARELSSPAASFSTDATSTKQYVIAAEMIEALGHAGSVLVVTSTKADAQRLARELARLNGPQDGLDGLVEFVRQELGDAHPLVACLRSGVGFHHAGLPVEVLEALETAVRDERLAYLACTSTLTDGVNLPVRTVVIYDAPYPGQPEESRFAGARLVNAIGRAGRAGIETEGWIVLIRTQSPSDDHFDELNPTADRLEVRSSLLVDSSLAALAAAETRLSADADAIFSEQDVAADFISFIWTTLSVVERRALDPASLDISNIVAETLAGNQADPAQLQLLQNSARAVQRRYITAPAAARLRWAQPGTSIGSARILDQIAESVARELSRDTIVVGSPGRAVDYLSDVIRDLYSLQEAPPWKFKPTSRSPRDIDVDPVAMLGAWIDGASLPSIASRFLKEVEDDEFRSEQVVGAVSQHFEHYLAWLLGALVELVNSRLEELGSENLICPELGSFVRFGVSNEAALRLLRAGLRSRRLANTIAMRLPETRDSDEAALRSRLALMTISDWRTYFDANSSDLIDLLEFTRRRKRNLLTELLESGVTYIALAAFEWPSSFSNLQIREAKDEPDPRPFGVYAAGKLFAYVATEDHADVASIIDSGFALTVELDLSATKQRLRVSLEP